MNELTLALETTFELIRKHLGFFVGVPLAFSTFSIAMNLVKVMCLPPRRRMIERIEIPALSNKQMYVPPVLHLHECPVSSDCKKCRFYNTDRCLRGYL